MRGAGAEGGRVGQGCCCFHICAATSAQPLPPANGRRWVMLPVREILPGVRAGSVNDRDLRVLFVISLRLEVGKARNISHCKNIIHIACHCLMLMLAVLGNAGDSLIKLLNVDISGSANQAFFCESSLKQ